MKIIPILFMILLLLHTVYAQDTGFFDTSDMEALTEEDYESLTDADIAEMIDVVDDITLLNEIELNQYIGSTYGNSLLMEDAVSGATLSSDGYLTNGEGGSQINLNDIPEGTLVEL